MKCNKCTKEATFDSPEPLCDQHWAEWWTEDDVEGDTSSHKERKKHKKEVLQGIKRKYPTRTWKH